MKFPVGSRTTDSDLLANSPTLHTGRTQQNSVAQAPQAKAAWQPL